MLRNLQLLIYSIFISFSVFASPLINKKVIYVYDDEGVGQLSLQQALHSLKESRSATYSIQTINAKQILQEKWINNAVLLVMPGGGDIHYVKKLNGKGNKIIKNFVNEGGTYLGICAGGYYGSVYVEFDKGGAQEVLGPRELAFFPGKAIGPILAPYDYYSNKGVRNAKLKFENGNNAIIYYNGGSYFENPDRYSNVEVLAYYEIAKDKMLPAILHINYGKGNVILSGVHFEYDPSLLDKNDKYIKPLIGELQASDNERKQLLIGVLRKLNI